MQDLFEYAVIRVMPKVEREEFFNVGVILYCSKKKFLQSRFFLSEDHVTAFACEEEQACIIANLQSFEQITEGGADAGPIGKLDNAARFRWLTATRSTVVQSSKVHSGYCDDLEQQLDVLFEEYVG